MGTMLKGEKDLLTLQIQCSGPARGLTVTADANGHVKDLSIIRLWNFRQTKTDI